MFSQYLRISLCLTHLNLMQLWIILSKVLQKMKEISKKL
nr:MAG TPA: hypothetical protein [Caudoviricetes sp.]